MTLVAGLLRKTISFQGIIISFSGCLRYYYNISTDMKLYCDKGNPNLLRILVAKNLSGIEVQLQYVDQEEKQKLALPGTLSKLPVLEVNSGHFLVSPNAICRYFMESNKLALTNPDHEATSNHWIEWESTQLQPAISSQSSRSKLSGLLTQLDVFLKEQKSLAGETPGLADVVVWGSLYPLLCQEPQILGSQYQHIKKWNSMVSSHQAFKLGIHEGAFSPATFKNAHHAQSTCESNTTSVTSTASPKQQKPSKTNKNNMTIDSQKLSSVKANESSEENSAIAITKIQASPQEVTEAFTAWTKRSTKQARRPTHPILPIEGEKNYLINSALPYVNNVPHLGNIIGCVLSADVFARYCRLRGYNTLYICGTDEYGTATETKALDEGLTPKEICDKYFKIHSEVYSWFNIDFDYFGRTTTEQQTKISQDIFWRLHKKGHLLEDTVEQLQCTGCKRFLADRFVEGTCPFCNYPDARGDQCDACGKLINAVELKNPKCKVCGDKPEVKCSKHLFINLAELEPTLKSWVDKSSSEGDWTANARQITRSWIQEGLKPRCITRDLKWGTPVPLEGYTDKVFYVWFDAPIGYLSITANYTGQWEKWWKNPQHVTLYQFMAKDNVPFHTVVFPCTLIGADDNYTLVNSICATEYLNYEDDKFSKSRGVGVFGDNAEDSGIPADIWRFYLLYMRPEGQDSNFSWSDFVLKNNSELLSNLGNFINRALMFLHNNFDGVIPTMDLTDEDKTFIALVNREVKTFIDYMEKIRLREGLKVVLNISKYGNQYMQANKPWVSVKGSDNQRKRAGTVIGLASNLSFLLSVLIHPYMPTVSSEIRSQLQIEEGFNVLTEHFIPVLKQGHKIGQPKPLFQKIEPSVADELKKKYAGKQQPKKQVNQDVEQLQKDVTAQGEKVRTLKANKAEKAVVDAEVTRLLDLKKQLALAQGLNPAELNPSSKSKKKNKKK